MLSFKECHFCKSQLYNGKCVTDPCNSKFEYQVYYDLGIIDFYIDKYIFEYTFYNDESPKMMFVFDRGYDQKIISLNYHIDINENNYLNLINKIENLKVIS